MTEREDKLTEHRRPIQTIQAGNQFAHQAPPPEKAMDLSLSEKKEMTLMLQQGTHIQKIIKMRISSIIRNVSQRKRVGGRDDMIGYKIMPLIDGKLNSGANKNLGEFDLKRGAKIAMPGNGVYLSTNRNFVLENYSGLAEEEVLLSVRFDPKTITGGCLEDKEPDISVPEVTVLHVEHLYEGELLRTRKRSHEVNTPGF